MKFQGAYLNEQGVTFAIVIVKPRVLSTESEANRLITSFQQSVFGDVPVILMAQNSRGVPTYYGRRDLIKFMARVPLHAIPWKQYTLS